MAVAVEPPPPCEENAKVDEDNLDLNDLLPFWQRKFANRLDKSIVHSLHGRDVDLAMTPRRQDIFGNPTALTQDIVRAYGLTFEDADAKKKTGDLPDGYEQELLEPFLENAALEVTRAIQFFFTSTPYTNIDHIFLAGGCAVIPGLVEMVADRTKVSSAVVSPFKGMQLSSDIREKQLRLEAPAYLVACGLAMRRFD